MRPIEEGRREPMVPEIDHVSIEGRPWEVVDGVVTLQGVFNLGPVTRHVPLDASKGLHRGLDGSDDQSIVVSEPHSMFSGSLQRGSELPLRVSQSSEKQWRAGFV